LGTAPTREEHRLRSVTLTVAQDSPDSGDDGGVSSEQDQLVGRRRSAGGT
jgi:hypothetical protein